jgi:glycosyltransferase involved in cell wall biosynthesis
MATVDVLVPTYNRSAMLHQCLKSIQTQTYTDLHVTIGDDCSDDDTRTVAEDFCGTDRRFHYTHNTGIFGNTNALFTLATAPYVHFMHDDDWLEPCFYERMISGLEESPEAGLAWPRAIVFRGEDEAVEGPPDRFDCDLVMPGKTAFGELLRGNCVTCPAVVLRTSVLHEVGPFSRFLTADWLMWLRIALHHDLKFIDAPLFHLRLHEGQASADSLRMGKDIIDMFEFASGLEEFTGRESEIAVARFEAVCNCMMRLGVKDEPQAPRSIDELSSYFLRHVPDHHGAIRRVEMIALAWVVTPPWLRPRKGGELRSLLRHLLLPRIQR